MKVIKVKTTHTLKGCVVLWLLEILQLEYFIEKILLNFIQIRSVISKLNQIFLKKQQTYC